MEPSLDVEETAAEAGQASAEAGAVAEVAAEEINCRGLQGGRGGSPRGRRGGAGQDEGEANSPVEVRGSAVAPSGTGSVASMPGGCSFLRRHHVAGCH